MHSNILEHPPETRAFAERHPMRGLRRGQAQRIAQMGLKEQKAKQAQYAKTLVEDAISVVETFENSKASPAMHAFAETFCQKYVELIDQAYEGYIDTIVSDSLEAARRLTGRMPAARVWALAAVTEYFLLYSENNDFHAVWDESSYQNTIDLHSQMSVARRMRYMTEFFWYGRCDCEKEQTSVENWLTRHGAIR